MEKDNVVAEPITEKKTARTRKTTTKAAKTRTVDDLKPSDRGEVRNLRAWELSFIPRDGNVEQVTKGIIINPSQKTMFKLSEIEDQVNNGNELFCGIDGLGGHASLQIVDSLVREYVFGEPTNPVQLTSEAVNELLAIESKPLFNQRLSELVVTNSEKRMIAIMCTNHALYPDVNIDDAPSYKLAAIEKISGIKLS